MIKTLLLNLTCLNAILGSVSHTDIGTEYGEKGVSMYTESNHGPDGKVFLDPYFKKDIESLNREKILDAGCGAAPWAIYAAMQGGDVYAIDIQDGMLASAKNAIEKSGLTDKISLAKGDVAQLPYQNAFFDKALSLCVGCNLPPDSFEKHFMEFGRTVKEGGIAIIGAPASLDVVFTNGSISEKRIRNKIDKLLASLPENPDAELVSEKLSELTEVLSATFYMRNQRVTLVTHEADLKEGEEIWRKLPKLVVPNRYYSKQFYIQALEKNGFSIETINHPHFSDQAEWLNYNNNVGFDLRLGSEYVKHAPFVIFHAVKISR